MIFKSPVLTYKHLLKKKRKYHIIATFLFDYLACLHCYTAIIFFSIFSFHILHVLNFILFLFVSDADMQQFGIADFHMKELGTSQHGHLLGSKYMDTLQGKGTSR